MVWVLMVMSMVNREERMVVMLVMVLRTGMRRGMRWERGKVGMLVVMRLGGLVMNCMLVN